MLATKSAPTLAIDGINQQDFNEIQLVAGTYPAFTGLQQRVPGKTLLQEADGPVGNIYVFYMVFGRTYTLIDFGTIQIDEIVQPPIVIPGLPPVSETWVDAFDFYPTDFYSRVWGGGAWIGFVGVCESIIIGVVDPFLMTDETRSGPGSGGLGPGGNVPKHPPIPPPTPVPPKDPLDPDYLYPPGTIPDIELHVTIAHKNNSCTGQGTHTELIADRADYMNYLGSGALDSIDALALPIGGVTLWHGVKIGRVGDTDVGLVGGSCPGPALPLPAVYYVLSNGTFGM